MKKKTDKESMKKPQQIYLRLPQEIVLHLKQEAEQRRRSLNQHVLQLLLDVFETHRLSILETRRREKE